VSACHEQTRRDTQWRWKQMWSLLPHGTSCWHCHCLSISKPLIPSHMIRPTSTLFVLAPAKVLLSAFPFHKTRPRLSCAVKRARCQSNDFSGMQHLRCWDLMIWPFENCKVPLREHNADSSRGVFQMLVPNTSAY
jgi:hypothetical protein